MALLCFALSPAAFPQTYEGYTLYAPQNENKAYLVNMSGTNYKTWTFISGTTCYSTYLLPGGDVLRTINHAGNSFSGGPVSGEVQKVNWSGTVVWDFVYSTTSYCSHHDIHPMPNGNVLLIAYERKTATEVFNAGCSQSIEMWPEKIAEIQPSGSTGGTLVWEWHVWDHLCQNLYPTKSNYVTSIVQHPELININYNTAKDWMHANGIDYNATLDQIVFSSHMLNEIYVIDHSTTTAQAATHTGGNSGKGGDILYRWGNPAAYQASGTTIFNVVHDAHWIPYGYPNYANSLCAFNNKGGTGTKSCVDVFTPPYNGYNYTITLGSAYTPSTYNWRHTYSGSYTQDMGSSQHLPNGNVLVCIAQSGYLYEINPSQSVVWSKSTGKSIPKSYRYPPCYVTGSYTASATATPSTICSGNTAQLNVTATGGAVYSYSWASSPAGFTSSIQNPVVSPTVTTVYTVTITNGPCSTTGSVTVTVNPLPAAAAGANRSICPGQSTQIGANPVAGSTYSWSSVPPGFTSTIANPVVSPTVTTTYTVTETATSTGCSNSHSVVVAMYPIPAAIAGNNRSICLGDSIQIGGLPVEGNNYSWTSNPAGFTSTLANPVVKPAVSTTYTVTETSTTTGCSNSNSVTITVNPLPDAIAGEDRTITQGTSTQIGAPEVEGNTYSWISDPEGFTSDLANPVVTPDATTIYTLTETISETECQRSNSVVVTVIPAVPANMTLTDMTIGSGQSSCFNATITITLGDEGPGFVVESEGSVLFIAGESIHFQPNCDVNEGGYLLAAITTTDDYCESKSPALPGSASRDVENTRTGGTGFFTVYPNPCEGRITLELLTENTSDPVSLTVMSMQGAIVFRDTFGWQKIRTFTFDDLTTGLYLLRVTMGDRSGNLKIMIQ